MLSGRRIAARFRELEVEITDDTPDGLLDEVLERLRAAGAGAPDPTPKYERAVGPLATQPPEVEVAPLTPAATVSQVVGRALAMSVVHLLRHDVVMRLDADPEGVHQARVASRRLRSDLRTFRATLDPEWVEPLREELRWLGTILGEARDADVLLARLQGRTEMIPATEAPGVAQVIEALQQRRKEAHRADRVDLRRAVRRAPGPAGRGGPAAGRAPGQGCARQRDRRRSPGGAVGSPAPGREGGRQAPRGRGAAHGADQGQADALRGRRRGADPGQAGAEVRRRGGRAPGDPGEHNDAVVAGSWLRTWAAGRRSGDAAFAAGMLAGIERAAANDAQRRWRKAWKGVVAARGPCDEDIGEAEGRASGRRPGVAHGVPAGRSSSWSIGPRTTIGRSPRGS